MIQKKGPQKNEKINNQKRKPPQKNVFKAKKEEPPKKIPWPEPVCEKCGKPIKDIAFAVSNKTSGEPVHFDCVLNFLKDSEELQDNEEILYMGGGNFAVVWFENPNIRKHFKIRKLIEWEVEGKTREWRQAIVKLGSST